MSIAAEVEQFIVTDVSAGRGIETLAPDEDLLEIIDSLGIVELISFLEGKYGIKVDDEDLDPEHFRSLQSIVALVESKGG